MNSAALETATITVQSITWPPQGSRKSGNIKDSDGQVFGAWPDKLNMLEQGETYEIAFTVNKGFRDIVGMPKKVRAEQPLRGEFTQVSPTPRNGATLTTRAATPQHAPEQQVQHQQVPKASQSEHIFTCGGLYRDIEMGRVGITEDELVERTILWRNVYRRAFPE